MTFCLMISINVLGVLFRIVNQQKSSVRSGLLK